MRLIHWMRKESSGLAFSTLELAREEERQGHKVCVREPQGQVLYGQPFPNDEYDVDLIHSQLHPAQHKTPPAKFLWCHGEPLSSVSNGISWRACIELARESDALICMRKEEQAYWNLIKRTLLVNKGIDLELFRPLPVSENEKLSGSPSVLYMEHWRGQRNPLPLVIAMHKVWKQYPDARLHLYNCTDKRMYETFHEFVNTCGLSTYVRSLQGPVPRKDVNALLNRVDIVVSCLHPLYARSIEALAAGRAFLCPGYSDAEYPFHCELDPDSMADAIINIWENGCGKFDFRGWAEKKHNIADTVRQATAIYERYIPR